MKIPDRILDDKINLEHECAFSLSLQSRRRAFVDFPIDIIQAVPFSADIIASHYSRVDKNHFSSFSSQMVHALRQRPETDTRVFF